MVTKETAIGAQVEDLEEVEVTEEVDLEASKVVDVDHPEVQVMRQISIGEKMT